MIKKIQRLKKHHNVKTKDAVKVLVKARFDYNLAREIVDKNKYKIVV